ncbi:hypothetical protein BH11PAT4_BH11PAT4_5190 [soil metagenome]
MSLRHVLTVAAAFLLLATGSIAVAEDYSSGSYTIKDPVIGQGAADASSTSFQESGSSGANAEGGSSSTSYGLGSGGQDYDTTEPVIGTVSDSSGADIDSQSSMTTLEANWSGWNDPESGIAVYEYKIQREVDNQCWSSTDFNWTPCNVWNNNGTNTSFTQNNAGLALRTGTLYITCVRARNNSNLTSSAVCTDGVGISPSTTISYSTTANFPALNPTNSWGATSSTVLSIVTNAYNGYIIYGSKTDLLRSTTSPTKTIADISDSGCVGAAVHWPGGGFGFTSSDDIDGNKFTTATKYCSFPTTVTPTLGRQVADRVSAITGSSASDSHTITYRTQVTAVQEAGQYQTGIIYTIIPQY